MKRYCTINRSVNWEKILPNIQDENVVLINKSNNEFIISWGCLDKLTTHAGQFQKHTLQSFIDKNKGDYIFGYLSYDIKNNETRLPKNTEQKHNDLFFTVPEHTLICKSDRTIYFGSSLEVEIDQLIQTWESSLQNFKNSSSIKLSETVSKKDYMQRINSIKDNIQNGIIYEMNYCVNFNGQFEQFNAQETYIKLFKNSNAPFSAYISDGENIVLSASPERFLKKTGNTVISQPIKGTAKRGKEKEIDDAIAKQLANDTKEIAENVMIVDLVRNDLSKIATKNSVIVNELCKVYSFNTVHQLISTISCQLKPNVNFTNILQALFPMGSMTGAPKISAIQNIDHFESFNRGIYSGSIGYFEPNGNFDFNVVIRTIIANINSNQISCSVGGAITIKSNPEKEYEECLLKLAAIEKTLC